MFYVKYVLTISYMSKKKYIIRPELLKEEYLFCWDFDNTIINGNSHDFFDTMNIKGSAPKELINKFLADPATGLRNPLKLLSAIRMTLKHGHKIAITTLSEYPEVIEPALQKLGLTEDEINKVKIIAGPSSTLYPGKLKHIRKAMDHFGVTTKQSVYLIDDNKENCSVAKKNGYGVIRAETADSVEYLAEIHELITINSTTDEFIRDKLIDQEVGGLTALKTYAGTQKIDSSSFFPSPKPSSFQEKPLKNSSLRKKLCFEPEENILSSKSSLDDTLTKSLYLPASENSLLKGTPVEISGEHLILSTSESSD